MKKETFTVPSSKEGILLHGILYRPLGKIRGILHLVHGMTEFTGRYENFLMQCAEEGYLAFGVDLLGHGETGQNSGEFGFFAEREGWRHLIWDLNLVQREMKARFGEHPYFFLGHSFGSLILRSAVALKAIQGDKMAFTGSAGGHPAALLGETAARVISLVRGAKHCSDWLQKMVFGSYEHRFPENYPLCWVSVDPENLKRYAGHPYCTFRFTVSAMADLIHLNRLANSSRFYRHLACPVSFLSGSEDPVGGYGKIARVWRKLQKKGKCAKGKLYSRFRHEILFDFCKEEVTADLLSFFSEE